MEQTTVRLSGGAHAEMSEQGAVTIVQDSTHAIQLKPEQMYELVVWAVDYHLHYLDFKAHETTEVLCFECREPLTGSGKTYDLDEGAVTLCGPCTTNVEQTVLELQHL